MINMVAHILADAYNDRDADDNDDDDSSNLKFITLHH